MRLIIAFLTLQDFIGIISFTVTLVIISVVIFLIVTSAKGEDIELVKTRIVKNRKYYFLGLVMVLAIISIATLRWLPYPGFQSEPDEIVTVVGIQWDWEMAPGISNKNSHEFEGKSQISLPVNKRIKFIVTSDDVTHSFCIYNSAGVLLAQTQAMPQYKNELEYLFKKRGDYTILCLEYCGLAHPFMTGTIHVQ